MSQAIAVDVGGTYIRGGLVCEDGFVDLLARSPAGATREADALLASLADTILVCAEKSTTTAPVGVAVPGLPDTSGMVLEHCANLPSLYGVDIVGQLTERTGRCVYLLPDVNAAALAEYRFGSGRERSRMILASVGTGVGAAVVLDGRLVQHTRRLAGSLGHLILNPTGPRCACGARGCIEALAAGPALLRAVERHAGTAWLAQEVTQDDPAVVWTAVRNALTNEDVSIVAAVEETAQWLGVGIANWATIYNPQCVVLAGGLTSLGDRWLTAIRRGFEQAAAPFYQSSLQIVLAEHPDSAALIGAGIHALAENRCHRVDG